MSTTSDSAPGAMRPGIAAGVGLVSGALLITELALTRIFSVTMYYHFAFLAISIALFGLSASGVYVYLARARLTARPLGRLLAAHALAYAVATAVALACLVRLRVGLSYSAGNVARMLMVYALAALPFFTGGAVISAAMTRLPACVNLVYAADLVGAATGCVLLIPLLNALGAPGVVLTTTALAALSAVLFAQPRSRPWTALLGGLIVALPLAAQLTGVVSFDVADTKGHVGDRVLFSKWNSFSRVAVYDRQHGDWSLSPRYSGPLPETRFMDIDSAASTPILRIEGDISLASYLRYDLTSLVYHLKASPAVSSDALASQSSGPQGDGPPPPETPGAFTALIIGPGGGRDLLSALVFGAERVDGVEINPIIADDVMLGRFKTYSGGIYADPRVRIFVEDGRSFVRRSSSEYDVIQASLVDTWAATAAGAYTLTENTLYTVEAFEDYLDHLKPDGILAVTRWVFDGHRLVSLAQEACEKRGWSAQDRMVVVQLGRVATFLLKKTPFTAVEIDRLVDVSADLGFTVLYAPGRPPASAASAGAGFPGASPPAPDTPNDYARLIMASDRQAFYESFPLDVRPTTDDRPFFFHTTKLKDQAGVAFGRNMLFGNGLSALMTLMGISAVLVVLFVVGPLALTRHELPGRGCLRFLAYFGLIGAGFMLVEVAILQRFVLLLGHPVYSLTVTLFSLLLGTGSGSYLTRNMPQPRLHRRLVLALLGVAALAVAAVLLLPPVIRCAMSFPLFARMIIAASLLCATGLAMGVPLPIGMKILAGREPQCIPWAWGVNGALSVVGTTAAVFIAMNWGFSATLLGAAGLYAVAALVVLVSPHDLL